LIDQHVGPPDAGGETEGVTLPRAPAADQLKSQEPAENFSEFARDAFPPEEQQHTEFSVCLDHNHRPRQRLGQRADTNRKIPAK
jgi:hypothetical protein